MNGANPIPNPIPKLKSYLLNHHEYNQLIIHQYFNLA